MFVTLYENNKGVSMYLIGKMHAVFRHFPLKLLGFEPYSCNCKVYGKLAIGFPQEILNLEKACELLL